MNHDPNQDELEQIENEMNASENQDPAETADQDVQTGSEDLEELQAKVSELKDKHLRLLAEFDNYKKRTLRERLELMNSASQDVMLSLLPVLDDFDRAKTSSDKGDSGEKFSEGVTLVYNRLYQSLQNKGLKVIESTGADFDPEWHEAITEIAAPTPEMKGKVIDTIQKGYMLNDKIIRYAKVVVGN